ncbi:MAG: lipocalin-like domain-containing protein [Planctomycetota bacterium]
MQIVRRLYATVFATLLTCSACSDPATDASPRASSLSVSNALGDGIIEGYARAIEPPALSFPRDHGPHPEFRTEWWYVTGNVTAAASGRRFGIQLVFFRQALAATTPKRAASMAARDLIFAHAAVVDIDGKRFAHAERMARSDGLLGYIQGGSQGDGADATPLAIGCADWSATAHSADDLLPLVLRAGDDGHEHSQNPFSFELTASPGTKPIVLQGDRGLSQKSAERGNASIYYSMTRLPLAGTISIAGEKHEVAGLGWIDREWSTSALGKDQVGWDWFSLQLDDETEVMWYRLRREDGSSDPWSRGCFVHKDGTASRLDPAKVTAEPSGQWTAADGAATYPSRWRLQCSDPPFDLEVTPALADQELRTLVRYWEGSVDVRGTRAGRPVRGRGYLEMTGYAK